MPVLSVSNEVAPDECSSAPPAIASGNAPVTASVAAAQQYESTLQGKPQEAPQTWRPAQQRPLRCPLHLGPGELHPFTTEVDGWTCSSCGIEVKTGYELAGCRECNIDLCCRCAQSPPQASMLRAVANVQKELDELHAQPFPPELMQVQRLMRDRSRLQKANAQASNGAANS